MGRRRDLLERGGGVYKPLFFKYDKIKIEQKGTYNENRDVKEVHVITKTSAARGDRCSARKP